MFYSIVNSPNQSYARPTAPYRSRVSLVGAFGNKLGEAVQSQENSASALKLRSSLPYASGQSASATAGTSSQVLDWGRSNGVAEAYWANRTTYRPGGRDFYGVPETGETEGVTPGRFDNYTEYTYGLEQVGEIARAPMAMFEHDGNLVLSTISRSGISETPVYSYSDETGMVKRGRLPVQAESGHYGFSDGDTYYLVPESYGGMVVYSSDSLDGPYQKEQLNYLNPHDYKDLRWGYAYRDEQTGQQFLGYGLAEHPGLVITKKDGEWQTFAAAEDMRFPTGMGVIHSGQNEGTTLISSSYGGARVHAVNADGEATKVADFEGWGVLRTDDSLGVAFMATDQGKVYYASYDDLDTWTECTYENAAGDSIERMPGFGEPNVHPQTGRMIFPAVDNDAGDTTLYETRLENGKIVLQEVAFLEGVGQWAGKSAVVGDDLYFGAGKDTGQAADRTSGAIYRITATANPSVRTTTGV